MQCPTLLYLKSTYISANNDALLIEFTARFDPYGNGASHWLDQVRSVLKATEAAHPGYALHLSGSSPTFIDILTRYYAA